MQAIVELDNMVLNNLWAPPITFIMFLSLTVALTRDAQGVVEVVAGMGLAVAAVLHGQGAQPQVGRGLSHDDAHAGMSPPRALCVAAAVRGD